MKFILVFSFILVTSSRVLATDISSGQRQSSTNSKPVILNDKCPTTLSKWVEDDFKDKRAIWSWPMPSEAKTCQMNLDRYGKALSHGKNLDLYLSGKFKDKINSDYKTYFDQCQTLAPEKQMALKVRFYESGTKLEASSSAIVDEIAAIDSVLPNKGMLEGIECSRIWPEIQQKCESSKKLSLECSGSKQERLAEYVKKTQEVLPQIESLIGAQHACIQKIYSESSGKRTGRGFNTEVQNKIKNICDPLNVEINRLADTVPWIRGEFFLEKAVMKKASPRNGKFATQYDLSSITLEKAIVDQLTKNREAYKKAYQMNRDDFSCLADKTGSSRCDFKKIRSRLLAMPDLRQSSFDLRNPADRQGNFYFEAESCLLTRGEDRERTRAKINGPAEVAAEIGAFVALSVATGGVADVLMAPRAITAGMSWLARARSGVSAVKNLTTLQKGVLGVAGVSQAHSAGVMGQSLYQSCSSELSGLVAQQSYTDVIRENVCASSKSPIAQAKKKETNCFVASALAAPGLLPFVSKISNLKKFANDTASEAKALKTKAPATVAKKVEEAVPQKKMPALTGVADAHPQKVLDVARYNREAKFFPAGSAEAKKFLNDIDDGTYVYIIDSKGNLAIVNREMKPQVGDNMTQNLGNHEGLARFIEAKTGSKPEVVAAGDYIMRLREATLTNQSGNFRGNKESLDYAKEVMQGAGASKNLQAINVVHANGSFNRVHTKAADDVNLALEYKSNPQLKQIWDETREVMSKFGNITEKEFNERLFKDWERHGMTEHAADISFFGWWKTPREGEAWAINKILRGGKGQESLDIPRYKELLATLRRIADQQ